MKYKKINGTAFCSAPIIFGTDMLGSVSGEEMKRLMDKYVMLGGNHIDTAALYGGGESERAVGSWMRERKNRNNILLSTKGGFPGGKNKEISRLSEGELRSDLEASLARLNTDCIDIYYLHRDDVSMPVAQICETLNTFVKEGKIRYFACSNWRSNRIAQANEYCKKHDLGGFVCSQIKWSAAQTCEGYAEDPTLVTMNADEYEFYSAAGMTVTLFASQAKGYFSKLDRGETLSDKARQRYDCKENRQRFTRIRSIAESKNIGVSAVALAFLLCAPFDTAAVVGCNSEEKLQDSMTAAGLSLTQSERTYIETGC